MMLAKCNNASHILTTLCHETIPGNRKALGDCLFYEILNEELTVLLIVDQDLLTLCLKRFGKD